jgi:small subunit ribosomal protein S15
MTVATERIQELVSEFGVKAGNNGAPDVQIAVLTERINLLTGHMRSNTKDYSSRRGLLRMVSRRRKLLDYVRSRDPQRYQNLIARLGIRK